MELGAWSLRFSVHVRSMHAWMRPVHSACRSSLLSPLLSVLRPSLLPFHSNSPALHRRSGKCQCCDWL